MRIKNLFLIAVVAFILAAPATLAQFSKNTITSQISQQFPDQNTGAITPATTRTFLNNLNSSFQQYAGLNKQVGSTYTIQNSDYGQIVTFNNGGSVAVALSPANSTGFTTFNFYAQNITNGNVVITPQAGTICGAGVLTLANSQSAWVVSDGTNWQCQFGIAGAQVSYPLAVSNGGTGGSTASGTLLDNITGFSSTGFVTRLGSGSYGFQSTTNGITLSNLIKASGANVTLCNPTVSNTNWQECNGGTIAVNLCQPQRVVQISGTNATYTTPTCNGVVAKTIEIEMVGGGGGGAGSGTTPGAATVGNNSCWKASGTACTTPLYQATGGGLGVTANGSSVAGGTPTGCDANIIGGSGGPGSGATIAYGGNGGGTTLSSGAPGGIGASGSGQNGFTAVTNTGGGGGGGGASGTAGAGGGGGGGGTCRVLVTSPLSSYVFTVGAAANGGSTGGSGNAGGNGAAGLVTVTARWQ